MTQAVRNLEATYTVDVSLCYPIVQAVIDTLKIQCGLEAKSQAPFFKNLKSSVTHDVSMVSVFTSEKWSGATSIGMQKQVLQTMIEKLIGEKVADESSLLDGALELLNMMLSCIRTNLSAKGHHGELGLPFVITGTNVAFYPLSRRQMIVIPIESDIGKIWIEFSTDKRG